MFNISHEVEFQSIRRIAMRLELQNVWTRSQTLGTLVANDILCFLTCRTTLDALQQPQETIPCFSHFLTDSRKILEIAEK
jgi:hypothetical protein